MTARDFLFALIGINITVLAVLLVLMARNARPSGVEATPQRSRSFVTPVIVAAIVAAVGVGVYRHFSPSDEQAKRQIAALHRQLSEAQAKAAADQAAAARKEEEAKLALEKARAAEDAAKKAGDLAAQKALAEARARAAQEAAERQAAAELAAKERIAAAEAARRREPMAPGLWKDGRNPGQELFDQGAQLELNGKGQEAVLAYTRAVRSGSGKAAKRLGEIYDKGIPGVPRDYAESLKWYNTARALGEDIKDERRQKAPALPDLPRRSSAEDFFALAVSLERESQFSDAARFYRLAARSGNGKAALRLGEIYGKGLPGVEMNYAEHLKWCYTARALGEEPNCAPR